MKKILFDLTATQPSISSKRHGGGRYGEVVLLRILERGIPVVCYYDSSRWLNPTVKAELKKKDIELYDTREKSVQDIVCECKPSLLYTALILDLRNAHDIRCPILFTWHGIRDDETPLDPFFWRYSRIRFKGRVRFLLKKYLPSIGYGKKRHENVSLLNNERKLFVMVSQHSRCSLLSYYPEAKGKNIPVFYSPSTSSDLQMARKYGDKYFLIVSGNRWSKNSLRAVMAFDRLLSMGYLSDYKMRITGANDASVYRYKIKHPEHFIFMGYVEDQELEQLYHDAYCLVYPSLNEGFGYPPLEAMHYGTPVIASAITSIPEVCGDAAVYFSPFSIEEIMARMLMMSQPETHQEYSGRSLERYQIMTRRQGEDLDAFIDYMLELAKNHSVSVSSNMTGGGKNEVISQNTNTLRPCA